MPVLTQSQPSGKSGPSRPFADVLAERASLPTSAFRRFWQLGYRRIVPIVPPDAEVSPKSTLARRLNSRQDGRGKTPGVRGADGLWRGLNWLHHVTVESDLDGWTTMGAGVGIRTGDLGEGLTLAAIDADASDPELARIIRAEVERRFGLLPLRIGRDPKSLFPVRVRGEFRYARVEFGERDANGRLLDRVEILTDGRQFVAEGIHPGTRRPYRWERPLPPLDELPIVDAEDLVALLDDLRGMLPAAGEIAREGGSGKAPADQKILRGDPIFVRQAVEAMANPADLGRDAYVDIAYAIKAALGPEHEAEGRALFAEWAERWEGAGEDLLPGALAETAEADFERCRPPFRRGASWLYEQAERLSGGTFTRASMWFQPLSNVVPLFPEEPREPIAISPDTSIAWIDPEGWAGKAIPPRVWEVEQLIPKGEVTLLYGDGGIGKTLVMHQYAVAASAGVRWLGQPTRQARVMCFFCEDGEDELQRRHADILGSLGLIHADTGGRLRIASRRQTDNLLALWDRGTGAMRHQDVFARLVADAKAFGAEVIILDTIADIFGGDEVNRAQVTAFVKGVLGRLAGEIGGTVIALGHPSQAGKQSGEGTSGSTGWSNAVRSRLYLSYPTGAQSGNVRELTTKKSNYGVKGAKLKIRWARGAFELVASSLPTLAEGGAQSVHPAAPVLDDAAERAVTDAINANPEERMAMSGRTSAYYAPKVLRRREPELLEAFTDVEVEAALERLERRGALETRVVGRSANRHPRYGLRVVGARPERVNGSGAGVFG